MISENNENELSEPPTITYQVREYQSPDKSVEVVYTLTSNGFIFKRYVNIPYLDDGEIDEEYFQEILNGQLASIIHKYRLRVIDFADPNASPETPEAP